MEKFDALETLSLIEKYRVTHGQWVPTMFVRMLKLPKEQRAQFDISSLECCVHAAAPCPIDVKKAMINWWGPIIQEFYGSTENLGQTTISCEEWLAHPGSVGKAPSTLHVCDDAGNELPIGQAGLLYFESAGTPLPSYLNDPEKTRSSRHPVYDDWMCVGDMGYVSEYGYLYITDRKDFTIISGGVNIYPQAIENALQMHEKVVDVAVIGVPNDDKGEEVKAVVQLIPNIEATEELGAELIAYASTLLPKYMLPRSVDFASKLPRSESGKLMKKPLRDAYWKGKALNGSKTV